MNQADRTEPMDAEGDRPAPGTALARMTEASARITESLELDSVLQGVVDGACSLTGARLGAITLLDQAGLPAAFISSGLSEAEHQLLLNLPEGMQFSQHLTDLTEPLRVADFSAYTRAAGLPEFGPPLGPTSAFLSLPIWHLGRRVGNIYLSDKDGEFSAEEEGVLSLFAAQAALAIANARRYREEQQMRASLETLVETSPVGVVVFDAASGALTSINREALRIVDQLRDPDQEPEQLLEALTYWRADGSEVTLQGSTLLDGLNSGATVRAEEIAIQVPDGRRVNTIINATPIPSPEGGVASVVVTMQDLAPIKEANRQRAEFLGLVSQELLAPLTSIKGSAAAVQEDLARLDLTKARQFFNIIEWQADRMRRQIADLVEVARIEAGTLFLTPEPTELASLVDQAAAAFGASGAEHPLHLELADDLPRVSADRQRALQVLDHLLANAASYSPEGSPVTISARRAGPYVEVCVADQGRGLAAQPLPLLFRQFSRREPNADAGGGESLGLAVCQGIVEAHGGRIWAENDGPGLGSRFLFTLPVAEESSQRRGIAPRRRGRPPSGGLGRILVLDDDPQAVWHIRNTLSEAGYSLSVGWEEDELERLIALERPHLVLLGGVQAGTDRLNLIKRVMMLTEAPLILLSGPGSNRDQELAQAFEAGADDYIVTPFSPSELAARVGAALRRREAPTAMLSRSSFELDGLAIDYGLRRVTLDGRALALTKTEYRLLCEFALYPGQTLSREHLMRRVWSARDAEDQRVVRAYVKRLRRKLGDSASEPRFIFNEPRLGYRLGASREPQAPPSGS